MKRIFSAGGIVFNKGGQVLVTKAPSLRDESQKHWGFPKGHIDPGESSKDAAIREVKEETGIEANIISKVGDSKYVFSYLEEKIFKVVSCFLMEYISGTPTPQIGEIEEAKWVSPDEALKTLSFPADRTLLKKALEMRLIL